ncbi:prolyl oligopeptidase family serine peptidase [Pseudonocardia charpentierae]|uniref:prolyl oligopeptidase n=1 Tax=Pseudonocardia charpentierae TaxID=3075545 RepID=A0ABU2NAH3_9PSEU|nr:prolyl oligopeptidase family serine peptidase [Pseudonocardia sp. DSM 45834]MDT0350884.1 prolyl oligopeptidase family serine peptidase [Pseudonocardia sp. DSM 45834]
MTVAPAYPRAERLDLVDHLHGRPVADPYRWLEDPDDPRTREWSAAQDTLARAHLDALPGRDRLAATLGALTDAGWVGVPVWRAGRRFASRREPGQEHGVVSVTDPDGTERVLLDPAAIDPTGLTTLDAWIPDQEGRLLAYQLSSGGDEQSVLHVLDVGTGRDVEPPIDRCRYSDVAWLPGGEEFFYVRMVAADEAPPGEQAFHRRIWRHRLGTPTDADVLLEGPGLYENHNYYGVDVSDDGRWLVVSANVGTARRDSVWIADLHGDAVLIPVLTQADDVRCGAWVERDGRLYLLTTDGAPRFRLAVTDPTTPGREHWRELVAEDPDSVLEGVRWLQPADSADPADGVLVLARSRHATAEVALHDREGTFRVTVPLPGLGSLRGLTTADPATPEKQGTLWIGWTDLVTPQQVRRFDLETGDTVLDTAAPGAVEVPPVRIAQQELTSADGTTVRMFVVSPVGGQGPRPALLTGYGGFGIHPDPAYSSSALAWVGAGGVYALVSLRGGGEEGEAWHRAGNRGNKQNVFDDFHAAAQALVDTGATTPDQLAILGGSNGGLLVGAALTQRPELYRAVVCSAPLLDMVRYEHFSLGRTWNDEYGTADDAEELSWLLSYSPYHHVRDGTAYPAVLFTVFDSDTRVDPLHARKMCAALQHATSGDLTTRPVLLRRETDVGHGARSVSRSITLGVDQLSFLASHTGLPL